MSGRGTEDRRNSTGLVQVEGGYRIKQGDRSSVIAFQLVDENLRGIDLDGEEALIQLVQGEDFRIIYETAVTVAGDRVSFTIDQPIPLGECWVEVKAGGYVFPSDQKVKLRLTQSATTYGTAELFAMEPMAEIRELARRQTYEHRQIEASRVWTIDHELGKRPSVTVIDTAGNEVFGDVLYEGESRIVVSFSAEFSGTAILN